MRITRIAILTLFAIVQSLQHHAGIAFAQQTRAEAISQQQDEKAARLSPYEPTKGERILGVKRRFIDTPDGFYPLFGSVYAGGGLALGGGYRHFYGDRTFWTAKGMWSIRNYKLAEVSTISPGHANGRIDLAAQTSWMDATQVGYYGLGIATSEQDRTNFRFQRTRASAGVRARPASVFVLGAEAGFEDYQLKQGLGQKPSIEERYTAATAPGLGLNPSYVHSTGSAGIDWRSSAGYARRGGLYELRYHNYHDIDAAQTFNRMEAEALQHVPILRENWVLSFRGLMNSTISGSTPYFLLPSLGGGDTLRGYAAWRYRDRHSILLQGEFRWIPNRMGLDIALFYDAGKVTSQRSALDLTGLKKDAGIEVRFHGPTVTPLRVGLARGTEGWHVVFGGGAAF
jgi:Omp85 superfamily domain